MAASVALIVSYSFKAHRYIFVRAWIKQGRPGCFVHDVLQGIRIIECRRVHRKIRSWNFFYTFNVLKTLASFQIFVDDLLYFYQTGNFLL